MAGIILNERSPTAERCYRADVDRSAERGNASGCVAGVFYKQFVPFR